MGKDNNSKIVTKEITMMEPAYPKFRTYVKRLETFQGWPSDKTQTPQDLADAGFFFTNNDDETVCYHCGGGLKSWEKGDQPWIEHSRWFNRCVYIRTVKGEDFIQRAISGASVVTQTSEDEIDTFEDEIDTFEDEIDTSEDEIDSSENNTVKMCKVCYKNPYEICFVPCGHVMACARCAMSIVSCPVCRTNFTSLVKLVF